MAQKPGTSYMPDDLQELLMLVLFLFLILYIFKKFLFNNISILQ